MSGSLSVAAEEQMLGRAGLCFVLWLILGPAARAGDPPPSFHFLVDGLASRLTADRERYVEGQMVWLYLDVFNAGKDSVRVAGGSLGRRLRLTRESGEALSLPDSSRPDHSTETRIAPGSQSNVMGFYVSGNRYSMYGALKPGRYCATWPPQGIETVGGRRLPPGANTVTFEVVPKTAVRAQGKGSAYGEAKDGLATRLCTTGDRFQVGAPIHVVVEARNVSQQTKTFESPRLEVSGWVDVSCASGEKAIHVGGCAQGMVTMRDLKPGGSMVVYDMDLSRFCYLQEPGSYTAKYAGDEPPLSQDSPGGLHLPPSGEFRFEILPGTIADPLVRALGVLVTQCPEDWCVRVWDTPRLAQPGPQWSRVWCCSYRLEHKSTGMWNRPRGKRVQPVMVWVAKDKAAEEPWDLGRHRLKRLTEYLGESADGHLYLGPLHKSTLEKWPSAREEIKKWFRLK